MKEGIIIVVFLAYHGVNVFLGWQNKQVVQKRLNHYDLRQIEHFWWGFMYAALCAPWYWVLGPWFVAALVPLHLSIFSVAYNDYRGLDPFDLSRSSKAITNKTLVRMGFKNMKGPVFGAEVLAIIFIIITIVKL